MDAMTDEGPTESRPTGGTDPPRPRSADGGTSGQARTPDGAPNEDATNDREDTGSSGVASWRLFVRDVTTSALAVVLVGAYLFAISGVWPPLVAIESGSMEPHMQKNDLVFVTTEDRFAGEGAINDTGVVPMDAGQQVDYEKFGGPGDVVVFRPDGQRGVTPIIHRAMFHVEKDENWVQRANQEYLGRTTTCRELTHCPANRSGFITKGDANPEYDQVRSLRGCDGKCDPVRAQWVVATAEVRLPGLGRLRLQS